MLNNLGKCFSRFHQFRESKTLKAFEAASNSYTNKMLIIIFAVSFLKPATAFQSETEFRLAAMDVHSIHGFTCVYGMKNAQKSVLNGSGISIVPVLVPDVLDSYCDSAGPLVQSYYHVIKHYEVDGIEGPSCPAGMETFAMLAEQSDQKIPLMQYEESFVDYDTTNGADLETASSCLPSFRKEAKALLALLVEFGWTHNIGLLSSNQDSEIQMQAGNLPTFYERYTSGRMTVNAVEFDTGSMDEMKAAMTEMKSVARGKSFHFQNEAIKKKNEHFGG